MRKVDINNEIGKRSQDVAQSSGSVADGVTESCPGWAEAMAVAAPSRVSGSASTAQNRT
jgi:hypothetical protein